MKKYASIFLLASCLFILPRQTMAENYSGQWLGTITDSVNTCENLGKAEPGEYKLTVIHKENRIVIMENVVQRPYDGRINPEQPHLVHFQGAYVDDGGYVNELLNVEFTSDSDGKGESMWRWSDGYYACGGKFNFRLSKIRP